MRISADVAPLGSRTVRVLDARVTGALIMVFGGLNTALRAVSLHSPMQLVAGLPVFAVASLLLGWPGRVARWQLSAVNALTALVIALTALDDPARGGGTGGTATFVILVLQVCALRVAARGVAAVRLGDDRLRRRDHRSRGHRRRFRRVAVRGRGPRCAHRGRHLDPAEPGRPPGRVAPPGRPRSVDGSAQQERAAPDHRVRPPSARPGRGRCHPRRAAARHRPLQGDQRHLRAPGRGRGAGLDQWAVAGCDPPS